LKRAPSNIEKNGKKWYNNLLISIDRSHWPYIRLQQPRITESVIGRLCLTLSTICGSTFSGFAKTLERAFSPLSLVFVSEVLNFFFILFSFGFLPTITRFLQLQRRQIVPLLVLGVLSGILGPLLWFTGLGMTTAINASLFARSEVIFILTLAHFVLGEKIERAHFVALCTILAGLMFVSLQGFTANISFQFGDLIIVAATLCYASGNIIYRRFLPHLEPHIALFARSLCALTGFLILSSIVQVRFVDEIGSFDMMLLPALIGFCFISRFLNSLLFYQAIGRVPMTTVGLFTTMEVIGSTLFAAFYLGEHIRWFHLVGGSLLVLGNVLLTYVKALDQHHHHSHQSIHPHLSPGA
jgi:drug/metabolite transporter (DMT)-like permease